ncbi:MAG: DUF1902 domain-containing protein, partial [Erysipelotrichaceae bacterium]|nr:DUF1902 domain-containing protein [Erysipelotrichaceae bacterium]
HLPSESFLIKQRENNENPELQTDDKLCTERYIRKDKDWNMTVLSAYDKMSVERRNRLMEYVIHFDWDNDAKVWIATSDDIPGLVLESESFDLLTERVRTAVPELLEMNQLSPALDLLFLSKRREKISA